MKNKILNFFINKIKVIYRYNSEMIEKLSYGLNVLYLSITKLFVIIMASFIFGTSRETILLLTIFSFIRAFAHGLHMDKSYKCYMSSIISFVLLPYMFTQCKNETLIFSLCFVSIVLYAPSDTHNKPLINKRHRNKLKLISIFITILLGIIMSIFKNNYINKIILTALSLEAILINPITYKLFNLPYNNYRDFAIDDRR